MPDWLSAILPLVGVALGYLAATSQDAKRWRRDLLLTVVTSRRDHYLSLVDAMYAQQLLINRAAAADPLEPERALNVTTTWRTQYARNLLLTPPAVQDAVWQFDVARGAAIEAINANQADTLPGVLADLDRGRLAVVDAINHDLAELGPAMVRHALSPWQRLRTRRIRAETPASST